MARLATVNKWKRVQEKANKLYEKREEWKRVAYDPEQPQAKRLAAQKKLVKTRRFSKVRDMNRCSLTGRGHGVYRRFKICRNEIRRLGMRGYLPGLRIASW